MTFNEACMKYRGRLLTGVFRHCCFSWDELPFDETCPEWPCNCAVDLLDELYPTWTNADNRAVFCEHANENPSRCRCPWDCYCKFNTCKDKEAHAETKKEKNLNHR